MESGTDKYRVESVARAAGLLSAFLRPPHRFGVTELSRATQLTKNQTFRLLQTLLQEELVVQDPDTKAYTLGYRLVELGGVALRGSTLVQVAAPVLDAVAEQTGETINLIARAGDGVAICVDKRESRWALQISARVGARFALHAGATPKLLLAFSAPEVIEAYLDQRCPLTRFTPYTLTERDELLAELERIRRQGYAVSDEDLDLGACAVAAPIRDHRGVVVAGISVASPVTRFGPDERQRNTEAALGAAREISQRLAGYWPVRPGGKVG